MSAREKLLTKAPVVTIADVFVLALAVAYAISYLANLDTSTFVPAEKAMPYFVIFFFLRICFIAKPDLTNILCILGIAFWGVFESCYGILQYIGILDSNNSMFPITGSFRNPGPLGGFLATTASVSVSCIIKSLNRPKSSLQKVIAASAVCSALLSIIVLILSLSRAGWLALFVALICVAVSNGLVRSWILKHKSLIIIAACCAVALVYLAFLLKPESALGRFHIWNIESRAIIRSPLCGSGPNTAMGTYGREQELFFRENYADSLSVRLAGCPEYPFNEYLGIGMETGVFGFLFSILIVLTSIGNLKRNGSVLLYGIIALAVFAFFSYPFRVPQTAILFAVFLSACKPLRPSSKVCESGIVSFLLIAAIGLHVISVMSTGRQERWKRSDVEYLFNEGVFYRRNGLYDKSNVLLSRGTCFSSDVMFHILMGRNYEDMGDFDIAMSEYEIAHYMVPCRVYPLRRMMLLYLRMGHTQEAVNIGKQIIEMPINERNPNMTGLVNETKQLLDSLSGNPVALK